MGKRINFSAVFDDVHVCWVTLHVFRIYIHVFPFRPLLFHSQSFLINHSWLCFPFSLDTLIREQVVRSLQAFTVGLGVGSLNVLFVKHFFVFLFFFSQIFSDCDSFSGKNCTDKCVQK